MFICPVYLSVFVPTEVSIPVMSVIYIYLCSSLQNLGPGHIDLILEFSLWVLLQVSPLKSDLREAGSQSVQ